MRDLANLATPDRRGLRNFAFTLGAAVGIFFGLLLPWFWNLQWPRWPWAVAILLSLWGFALPGTLAPLYRAWMKLGLLLNRVVSPLVLGLLFVLLFVPTALLFRLFRYDPLERGHPAAATSYRSVSTKPPREQMEKPY